MAILKKVDYLIKDTSSGEITTQLQSVITDLNSKQNLESNKIGGEFKVFYYGSIFDPRSKKSYYAFSDSTKAKFELANATYEASASGAVAGDGVDEARVNELILAIINDSNLDSTTTTLSSKKIAELLNNAVEYADINTLLGL